MARAGAPAAPALHGHDPGALPVRELHPGPGRQLGSDQELLRRPGRHGARPAEPVLGQRTVAILDLRARDHAVHHGVDHPPAHGGGHPVDRPAPEGRRVGLRQDQPVHALPDGRPRRRAGGRLLVPLPPAGDPHPQRRPARPDRRHAHGRDGAADVVRRADHEARHRERHLPADLRVDHRPRSARDPRLDRRRADDEALLPAARARRDRLRSSSSRRASGRSRSSTRNARSGGG